MSSQQQERVPQSRAQKNIWIDAWYDPLASSCVLDSCMTLADLNGDHDFKLLVAYSGSNPLQANNFGNDLHAQASGRNQSLNKLRVFKGPSMVSENTLIGEPIGVCSFYIDYKTPRRPVVVVGTSTTVYFFKNMQPYYRFPLPNVRISLEEVDIWQSPKKDGANAMIIYEQLTELRNEHKMQLSERSRELLSLTEASDIEQYVREKMMLPLEPQTQLTCMSVLHKDKEDYDSIGCLVLGCENQGLYVLEPSGARVMREFELPSIPCMVHCSGRYDIDYRITIACRNGKIYVIRNHSLSGTVIELESTPCAIVQYDRMVAVACMDNNIHVFSQKGGKQFSISAGHAIKGIKVLEMNGTNNLRCLVVALANRELRVYNGPLMIDSTKTVDVVTGMTYGIYGSEPNTLVLSHRNGGISFKIVARKASFDSRVKGGPPPEQNTMLNLPKRTSLYLELTDREKQLATDMHRVFQRELCKLRVTTSQAYLRVLSEGQSPISYTSGSHIRLNAIVQGLGPLFKINLQIHNTGTRPKFNTPIVFSFDSSIYRMKKPRIIIPMLAPSLQYGISAEIEQIDEEAGADTIKVFLLNTNGSVPLITAHLQMPLMMNMSTM